VTACAPCALPTLLTAKSRKPTRSASPALGAILPVACC
jgi:hypothetical protein